MGKKKLKLRNSEARSPLLSKGGAHQKSRGAQRAADKRQMRTQVRTWRDLFAALLLSR